MKNALLHDVLKILVIPTHVTMEENALLMDYQPHATAQMDFQEGFAKSAKTVQLENTETRLLGNADVARHTLVFIMQEGLFVIFPKMNVSVQMGCPNVQKEKLADLENAQHRMVSASSYGTKDKHAP